MRKQILISVAISSTAWSAGNVSEALCDNPGPGVTCECSEPLTVDDGDTPATTWDPTGTEGPGAKECRSGNAIAMSSSGKFDFQLGSDVGLNVGGDGYVYRNYSTNGLEGGSGSIDDNARNISDKTYCYRYYLKLDPLWYRGTYGAANIKGPRTDSGSGHDEWPSVQSSVGGNGNPIDYHGFNYGSFVPSTQLPGHCVRGTDPPYTENEGGTGCTAFNNRLARNQDPNTGYTGDIKWEGESGSEGLQSGWVRWEMCIDHNATAENFYTRPGYTTYPGPNRAWMRVRQTMITGPEAGKVQTYGPAYAQNPTTQPFSGHGWTRLWSSFVSFFACANPETPESPCLGDVAPQPGDNPRDGVRSNVWISYAMVATKSPTDPTYWIGPAIEVEGSPQPGADAGTTNDANGSVDAGSDVDSASGADASGAATDLDGGCGCRTGGDHPAGTSLWLILGALWLALGSRPPSARKGTERVWIRPGL